MMANLFHRRVSPQEIKNMGFSDLLFWNNIHNVLVNEVSTPTENI